MPEIDLRVPTRKIPAMKEVVGFQLEFSIIFLGLYLVILLRLLSYNRLVSHPLEYIKEGGLPRLVGSSENQPKPKLGQYNTKA